MFPTSTTPARLQENVALFDFALDDAEMARLNGPDKGEAGRTRPHPDEFDYVG